MKKIIALFVIMLAFGLNANAQQKAPSKQITEKQDAISVAARKDVKALGDVVKFEGTKEQDFFGLFKKKHSELTQNGELSKERKDVLAQVIEAKITATLTPEQNKKLSSNPALLQKLTH